MNSEKIKVAICQMNSIDSAATNLQQIEDFVTGPVKAYGAAIAFFPENCLYMRIREGEKIQGFTIDDPHILRLSALAQEVGVGLHLGSLPLRIEGKLFNASLMLDSAGVVRPSYKKIHLFDITLPGQKPIRESDVFTHGDAPQILEYQGWSFGQTICYDIRFAELFSFYARGGVDALLVPSAFLVKTGQAHWEVLLRARAIESQSYVIAAAQSGQHRGLDGLSIRETYGRSMVIDPWGQIVAEAVGDHSQVLTLELERRQIDAIRKQIPMAGHRRL
jgi:predicted amidohydrolase